MEKYKITSTSAHSSKIVDPVEIETTGNTRKVLFVELNDAKIDSGETVGITIVHQRKKGNDKWEDVESIPLSSHLLGAISQIQVNARTWHLDSQKPENVRELKKENIYTTEPKGILIIGNTAEFMKNAHRLLVIT